jgi:hypothetical protein
LAAGTLLAIGSCLIENFEVTAARAVTLILVEPHRLTPPGGAMLQILDTRRSRLKIINSIVDFHDLTDI